MSIANSVAVGTPSDRWGRFGALWTILFLAFPVVFAGIVFRLASRFGIEFAPLERHVASFLIYGVVACGAAVLGVWLWARPRGLVREIFMFRPLAGRDWLIACVAWLIGLAIFPVSQWLARILFGATVRGMNFDLHTPYAIPIMVIAAVIVGTFGEEVLFRGLGIAYLRSLRWPSWAVWLTMTLAFAAIHVPTFGVAGAFFVLFWGAMVTAIRLWRGSLSPGWIVHILNNATAYILLPLLLSRH
jgi:membrane protease YdiL (CAAX protease family)